MAKLFLEISAPANGKSYEFSLDNSILVSDLVAKLTADIAEFENGSISFQSGGTMLFSTEHQYCLPTEKTLSECGIKSGSRLIIA